jgi:hypothetical protein
VHSESTLPGFFLNEQRLWIFLWVALGRSFAVNDAANFINMIRITACMPAAGWISISTSQLLQSLQQEVKQ